MNIDPILSSACVPAVTAAGLWGESLILDDLDHWASTAPDRIAIVRHNSRTGEHTVLTCAPFARYVDAIATGQSRPGVGMGDVVSLQLPTWRQFNALHFAALRPGAITNPVMPIFRERELGFMLRLAESKPLVIPRAFRGFACAPMAETLCPTLPELVAFLPEARNNLPERPEVMPRLPKTPSGKIQKVVLRCRARDLAPEAPPQAAATRRLPLPKTDAHNGCPQRMPIGGALRCSM
ncbi:MAG TPA: AMP-binding protein [Acetobacteraceae bacterium]|nr:AMP-binding protein [Acetobacteraceae bacterium]